MGGVGFPPCWSFGLRQPNSGAYLGSLVGLMADSGRAHAKEYFPELLLPLSLSPWWATAIPCLCRRPSNTSREVWFSLPSGHCSFPWVPMHVLLCVCPPRVESLFPPVLWKSCNQIPLAFKVWFSRNSSSCCRNPRFWSLMWGSEPSLLWVDFCGISVFQSVSHAPSSYGIWFYCDCAPCTVSLWLLLCLWMCGIFFGEFQCLPVDDCPAASCDSGVLTEGNESTSFYSAILVQPLTSFNWLLCLILTMVPLLTFLFSWHPLQIPSLCFSNNIVIIYISISLNSKFSEGRGYVLFVFKFLRAEHRT